jgi:Mlc titration factor MtfA (ptsG expression regulator)
MLFLVIAIVLFVSAYSVIKKTNNNRKLAAGGDLMVNDVVLEEHVLFFKKLSSSEKKVFEEKVKQFLEAVIITPVNTEITDTDKLLIGAGAIIPVFRFPSWEYLNLKEVLVYSDTFNMDFQSEGEGRDIAGLVGTGVYNGKMLLSLEALRSGFENTTDKRNTVIHEFVHLIDKTDGETDGIPELLLDKQYVLPWLDLMHKEMNSILEDKSDIDDYGLTNKAEFFAVASEYFFERPDLLEEKHPQLFSMLQKMFVRTPVQ